VRIQKLSPEVEKVLRDWEMRTAKIKTMSGDFSRFKYDHTFEVEFQAEGHFDFASPDKGNYEIRGAKIEKGAVSKKKNKAGVPYTLKSADGERWVCNGKEVIRIDEKAKTFEKAPIPSENQGQNIIDGPLPFLFGMKADRAKRRYRDIKLLKNKDGEIWLEVRSKEEQDAKNWDTAVIIIDAAEFIPKAVKLKDVTDAESVHVFKDIVVNQKKGFFGRDPFNPSLRGYKQIIQPEMSKSSRPPAAKGRAPSDDTPDLDRDRTAESVAGSPSSKKSAGGVKRK
jgi:TIGR03009 family protein